MLRRVDAITPARPLWGIDAGKACQPVKIPDPEAGGREADHHARFHQILYRPADRFHGCIGQIRPVASRDLHMQDKASVGLRFCRHDPCCIDQESDDPFAAVQGVEVPGRSQQVLMLTVRFTQENLPEARAFQHQVVHGPGINGADFNRGGGFAGAGCGDARQSADNVTRMGQPDQHMIAVQAQTLLPDVAPAQHTQKAGGLTLFNNHHARIIPADPWLSRGSRCLIAHNTAKFRAGQRAVPTPMGQGPGERM
jgi:hypothetical protein